MKNSVKQMLRTPWKTGLFCLLIVLSMALFVVGLNLWRSAATNLQQADAAFVTIGTVQQKESSMRAEERWDAGLKEYVYRDKPVYDTFIPIAALHLDGVDYISGPEQRPFYSAYVPDCITYKLSANEFLSTSAVIEFVPVQDCVPSEPVEVDVVNVLYTNLPAEYEGRRIKLCDHYTEHPKPLQGGKTYIAYGNLRYDNSHENLIDYELEFVPLMFYSGQTDGWEEVYDGFYESKAGERWQHLLESLKRIDESTVPVTPTQDTQLLNAFQSGLATIAEGRDISGEEYATGAKVCLIPQSFAELNDLWPGDALDLGLYGIHYKNTASEYISGGAYLSSKPALENAVIMANGEPYDVFEENRYTIVGVYYQPHIGGEPTGYELGTNEIIVPAQSIATCPADHVISTGPMQGKNTSFRIPNGSAEAFMEAFSKIPESSLLEIQFYDNGYEQFAAGLKNLSLIGLILFCVGLASGVAVLSLVLYFYIVKQRKRAAIERALGMSKRQCAASLLLGILLLTALGATAGCAVGASIGGAVRERVLSEDAYFSTDYSRGLVNSGEDGKEADLGPQESGALLPSVLTVTGTLLLTLALASVLIRKNLGIAPILLLSAKGDE